MPPKENTERACEECIHFFACSRQCGEQMAQRSAIGCECYDTVKSIAADRLIERLTAENAAMRKEIKWKDMVIALAQRKQAEAEAERDALWEKQRWIPVTERLPERDVQVLGWYKDNPFSQYRPEVVAWNGNGWVFVYAHRYVTNVTHWMPLPELPEEGE